MSTGKFRVDGGRSGSITFDDPAGSGCFGWEMAFGDFSMGIVGSRWLTPAERQMEPHEIRRLLQEFATERNIAVEVSFPEGVEGFWPTPDAKLAADRKFYDLLGPERSDKPCRHGNCQRGAVSHSVLCRTHHFEMVQRRICPFNDVPNAG